MRTPLSIVWLAAITVLVGPLAAYSGTPLYMISTQVDPAGGGTVVLDPQKSGYAKNNIVTVSALPATDMVFTGWGGALTGTQNPTTLRVSGNQTVIAHFATTQVVVVAAAPNHRPRPAHCRRRAWSSATSRNGRSTGAATCRSTSPEAAQCSS